MSKLSPKERLNRRKQAERDYRKSFRTADQAKAQAQKTAAEAERRQSLQEQQATLLALERDQRNARWREEVKDRLIAYRCRQHENSSMSSLKPTRRYYILRPDSVWRLGRADELRRHAYLNLRIQRELAYLLERMTPEVPLPALDVYERVLSELDGILRDDIIASDNDTLIKRLNVLVYLFQKRTEFGDVSKVVSVLEKQRIIAEAYDELRDDSYF